jgi:hypothetical protein
MREYWNIDLKNQSAKRMAALKSGLALFGGIIHDSYEDKYFQNKQSWRNPLLLRVSLPEGDRFKFIRYTKIWLSHPERVGISPIRNDRPIPLRGNHDNCKLRRSYNLHFAGGWLKDFNADGSYRLFSGTEVLSRVLNGDLDLLLRER